MWATSASWARRSSSTRRLVSAVWFTAVTQSLRLLKCPENRQPRHNNHRLYGLKGVKIEKDRCTIIRDVSIGRRQASHDDTKSKHRLTSIKNSLLWEVMQQIVLKRGNGRKTATCGCDGGSRDNRNKDKWFTYIRQNSRFLSSDLEL